jgi:uncharacterized protein YycO
MASSTASVTNKRMTKEERLAVVHDLKSTLEVGQRMITASTFKGLFAPKYDEYSTSYIGSQITNLRNHLKKSGIMDDTGVIVRSVDGGVIDDEDDKPKMNGKKGY